MGFGSGIAGTFGAVWASVSALIKAGLSSGALQYIAAAVVSVASVSKTRPQNENVTAAITDAMGFFNPEQDNVEALTKSIARLTYALEQELKAREERAKEKQ